MASLSARRVAARGRHSKMFACPGAIIALLLAIAAIVIVAAAWSSGEKENSRDSRERSLTDILHDVRSAGPNTRNNAAIEAGARAARILDTLKSAGDEFQDVIDKIKAKL